uniref:Mucin-7 n=1 Tax=Callorhinus ursinus TaxID=34884 RepID=A0A3Q7Q7R4_CALUR|nr:mucin-7 [Callorhinus ursinus]
MKTLTLLACICALSACFSLSEGRKRPWKTQHRKNYVLQHILDRRLPLYQKFQPNWNMLIQKHLIFGPYKYPRPSYPIKRKPRPKHRQPSRCPVKNNTVVNNNTSGATTQIPSLSPTSTSNKITESPGVTSLIQTTTTIFVKENNTGSPAVTPTPQPSPALPDTTAAPLTSSPPLPEPTAAPSTSSLTTQAPQPSPALPDTTAAPLTSPPPLPELTAAPSTSSLTTPAPQPSPALPDTTAAPNTTPNPSPTTPAPETSQTTTAPTPQTTTPATTQTTVEQTTSPSSQNANSQFWQYIYNIIKKTDNFIALGEQGLLADSRIAGELFRKPAASDYAGRHRLRRTHSRHAQIG